MINDSIKIESLKYEGFLDKVINSRNPSLIFIGDYSCEKCHEAFQKLGDWWLTKTGFSLYYVESKTNPEIKKSLGAQAIPAVYLMVGKEVHSAVIGSAMSESDFSQMYQEFNKSLTLPPLLRRIKLFLTAILRAIKTRKLMTSKEEVQSRLSKCNTCVFNKNKTCSDCGCAIKLKTKMKTESCPRGHWSAE
jgi:thioredoxin-like negative regulator of GroEL